MEPENWLELDSCEALVRGPEVVLVRSLSVSQQSVLLCVSDLRRLIEMFPPETVGDPPAARPPAETPKIRHSPEDWGVITAFVRSLDAAAHVRVVDRSSYDRLTIQMLDPWADGVVKIRIPTAGIEVIRE
jgi:hypothetical protein